MYNVFVSYLRDDKTQALRLADELQSHGAIVWVDVSDLLPGEPWREEIGEAIRETEFFLACFSSTYEERPDNGMLEELNYVIQLRKSGQKHPEILPIKLNECDIPDISIDSDRKLNELHWLLLDDTNWDDGVRQLVELTLRMARERAKNSLKMEAEEVAERHSALVRAQEELKTHERRVIREQVHREMFRDYDRQRSPEISRYEPPSVWPAQQVTKNELEHEYALSQYRTHQVEFAKRFGEDYHPLAGLVDEMNEEEKRIQKSSEDARRAEEASIDQAMRDMWVLLIGITILIAVLAILSRLLKWVLGF
jgi:hypothetical protein